MNNISKVSFGNLQKNVFEPCKKKCLYFWNNTGKCVRVFVDKAHETFESTEGFADVATVVAAVMTINMVREGRSSKPPALGSLDRARDAIFASRTVRSLHYIFSGKWIKHIEKRKIRAIVTEVAFLVHNVAETLSWLIRHRLLSYARMARDFGKHPVIGKLFEAAVRFKVGDLCAIGGYMSLAWHRIETIRAGKTHPYYFFDLMVVVAGLGCTILLASPFSLPEVPIKVAVALCSLVAASSAIFARFCHDFAKDTSAHTEGAIAVAPA